MKLIKSQNNGIFLLAFESNSKPDSAWLPREMFPVLKKLCKNEHCAWQLVVALTQFVKRLRLVLYLTKIFDLETY